MMSNLAGFSHTQLNNLYSSDIPKFSPILKEIPLEVTFEVPVASFCYDNPSEAEKTMIRGTGLQEDQTKRNTFVGSPSAKDLSNLFGLGPVESRILPGTVRPDGYLAYCHSIKAMMVYSHFSHKSGSLYGNYMFLNAKFEEDHNVANLLRDGAINQDSPVMGVKVPAFTVNGVLRPVSYSADSSKQIKGAIMSPSIYNINLGEGIFFPYFSGMLNPDAEELTSVFRDNFFELLGGDAKTCSMVWAKVRTGLRNLAPTRAGWCLSHAFTGIRLSKTASAPITFLIESGVYYGFVLHGDITAFYRGKEIKSVTGIDIADLISSANRQDKVLVDLLALFNEPIRADGTRAYEFDKTDISSSRRLLRSYNLIEKDLIRRDTWAEEVREKIDQLIFGDQFKVPSVQMVHDFLRFINTGDHSILSDYPAYVADGYYRFEDRIHIGLGIFGPRAPTFSGTKDDLSFSLPRSMDAEDPNLAADGEGRHLRYLSFDRQPIRQAFSTWEAVFATGTFYLPKPRPKKQEFTDARKSVVKISGTPEFINNYNLIKQYSAVVRDGLAQGKRKRGQDEDSGGSRKMTKKAMKDIAGGI